MPQVFLMANQLELVLLYLMWLPALWATVLTALVARERTGKGTTVDVSMLDSTFSLMVQDLMLALGPHEVPHRIGNRHPDMYPFDTFDCKDQPIAICCGNDHLWSLLSNALGHPEWIDQANFKTNDLREKNWQDVKTQCNLSLKLKMLLNGTKFCMMQAFLLA